MNVAGTEHIVAACERWGVQRLVHVSSIVVLGLESPAFAMHTDSAFTGALHGHESAE